MIHEKKKSQSQKCTYHMIPFILNAQERQIHKDRKQISDGGGGHDTVIVMGFLLGVIKMF